MLQGDKLFLAPIDKSVKKVLDVGCGTGTAIIPMHPCACLR